MKINNVIITNAERGQPPLPPADCSVWWDKVKAKPNEPLIEAQHGIDAVVERVSANVGGK